MSIKNIFRNILIKPSIDVLTNILVLISILIPIGFALIKTIFPILSSDFSLLGLFMSCFSLSLAGFIQVYRKEAPGFITPVRGTWAIIRGAVLFLIFFSGMVLILICRFIYQMRLE